MVTYESVLPIGSSQKRRVADGTILLAADIGGTKSDLALYKIQNHSFVLLQEKVYASKEWHSFAAMAKDFTKASPGILQRVSIAAAGPVQDGKVQLTNLDWALNTAELRAELKTEEVLLINDLEAKAYGLATLAEEELLSIYAPSMTLNGNAAIIAPGTGLGEGGMYWDGASFQPFATEGGHTDFAPRTELDIELWRHLKKQFGHVSWERVVSGPGIFNIYQFLRDVKQRSEPAWLQAALRDMDPAQVISEHIQDSALCEETIHLFIQYLAIEASNLALKFKTTGGLYMGGGILPKIWSERWQQVFLTHFFQVGRMRPLIEAVPVYIILNSKTALLGAAYYGSYRDNT